MGAYLELHVGPYMLVDKIPIKVEVVKQVCTNSDCTNFEHKAINAPFCPQCGEKIRHKTFEKDDFKDVRDIIYTDEFQDELIAAHNGGTELSKTHTVLIPNNHIKLDIPGIDMDDEQIVEILPDRMEREIKWFFDEYPELIAAIIREFGEDAVQIKWGIIKHYN